MNRVTTIGLLAISLVACAPSDSPAQTGGTNALPAAARTPTRWDARMAQADDATRRGDRALATRLAQAIVNEYTQGTRHSSAEHVIAGRAYVLLSVGDAGAVRSALAAFDAGAAADDSNLEATRRAGDLFLDKYNAPDARLSFESVLKRAPDDAEALLGLARVEEFEGKSSALATARKAIAANAGLSDAHAFVARLQLESEQWDSAMVSARRAIAVDSSSMDAWTVLGAIGWLSGDSTTYRTALAAATRMQPRPSDFFAGLADAAVRQRRYAEAVRLGLQAVEYDNLSVRALGVLGTTQLRIGQLDAGRATLERAFDLDRFNLWHKNTLDLFDKLKTFRTIRSGRFEVVAPAQEADLLAMYITPLLERAFDSLQTRYGFAPPTPVRLEFYEYHPDFSVRSVGLNGLGALGVSFGSLLAMDAPSARERGEFNWGSTAWHELTHAFTLGASEHRVPRWLSEGMSVLEERRALPGWGADVSVQYLAAFNAGILRPMSQLNDGFLRPRFPDEIGFSYYQASLFCEMVEATKGAKALPAMLTAYRDGLGTPQVFEKVLGMTSQVVDATFDAWTRAKFKVALASITADRTPSGGERREITAGRSPAIGAVAPSGPFVEAMRAAMEAMQREQKDSARVRLERAQALFPEYAGADSPALFLARLAHERGDTTTALRQLAIITRRNETAWDANLLESQLLEARGDAAGAMAALERLVWIYPYDNTLHDRLANLATAREAHALALRERRAVVANRPADVLTARYELARALAASGDAAAARRELLQVLEQAPSFEKAQVLLLELRGKSQVDPR